MERISTSKGIKLVPEQVEDTKDYKAELIAINGIGPKTTEDILLIYPTYSDLKKAKIYPFNDKVNRLLKEYVN